MMPSFATPNLTSSVGQKWKAFLKLLQLRSRFQLKRKEQRHFSWIYFSASEWSRAGGLCSTRCVFLRKKRKVLSSPDFQGFFLHFFFYISSNIRKMPQEPVRNTKTTIFTEAWPLIAVQKQYKMMQL